MKIGEKYLIDLGSDNPNTKEIEIRGFVDDTIIFLWKKNSGFRTYDIAHRTYFELLQAEESLKPIT